MHLGALPAPECVCGINTNISQAARLRKADTLLPGVSEHEHVCVCVCACCVDCTLAMSNESAELNHSAAWFAFGK